MTQKDFSYVQEQVRRHEDIFEMRDFTEVRWGADRMVRRYQSLNESETVYVKVDDIVHIAEHAIANLARAMHIGFCQCGEPCNHVCFASRSWRTQRFLAARRAEKNPSMRLPWKKVSEINMSPEFTIERFTMSRCVVERWDCAALVHESFLDRVMDNTLCIFDFGWHDFNRAGYREHKYIHRSPRIGKEFWSQGARWSTNFFAFKPADLAGVIWQNVQGKGDEEEFTGPHAEGRDQHSLCGWLGISGALFL